MHRNLVRSFPVEDVTRRNEAAEDEAGRSGLAPEAIAAIWRSLEALYRTRLHPALSFCLRVGGHVVLDRAIGHRAGNAPGDDGRSLDPATPDTLFNLFSASKAITAMVVHLLDQRGLVHLDDPVIEYLPEFGRDRKGWMTLRHLLTHRAGIPSVPGGAKASIDLLTDPQAVVALLADIQPLFPPGRRLAYHALTGGYVIGEIVRRVMGRDIGQVLASEVLEPLGIRHLRFGVTPAEVALTAVNAFTGPTPPPPFGWLLKRALGVPIQRAVEISNDPRFLHAVIPAGNAIGTANEACRFFELLRCEGELDGVRIYEPRTVRRAVAEQTYLEMDLTLGLPVRYGLGFMLGSDQFSIYGPHTGRAYGHLGFTNVVVWADPPRRLSACLMTSGKPFISPRVLRWLDVMRTVSRQIPFS